MKLRGVWAATLDGPQLHPLKDLSCQLQGLQQWKVVVLPDAPQLHYDLLFSLVVPSLTSHYMYQNTLVKDRYVPWFPVVFVEIS